jgi:hypothetical protein
VFHDVNGTGGINSIDVTAVRNRQFTSLPSAEPATTSVFMSTLQQPSTTAGRLDADGEPDIGHG